MQQLTARHVSGAHTPDPCTRNHFHHRSMLSTFSSTNIIHHIEPWYLSNLGRVLLPTCLSSSWTSSASTLLAPGEAERAASPPSSGRVVAKHEKQPRAYVFQVTTSPSSCSLKCMPWGFIFRDAELKKRCQWKSHSLPWDKDWLHFLTFFADFPPLLPVPHPNQWFHIWLLASHCLLFFRMLAST